ncbi:FYN-binding protein 1 [Brienomyrus brachyistius]|uniref:FYN-binding protein 1 n=1 Tax=Brienomyrus brachyistius TaxID=42636 RepID=UPI0020B2B018|nr:FYN-binding protein 1 [Brienomyrus brachyistius]XP_048854275.1 FYN-binding protein 1 [Brienomyrus brachyistius]
MAHVSSVQARRAALEGALGGKSANTPEPPSPAFKAKLSESQSSGGTPRAPPQFTKPSMPKSSLGGDKPTPVVSSVLPKPYQAPEWPKNQNNRSGSPKPIRGPSASPFTAPEPEKQAETPLRTKSNFDGGNKFSNVSPMSSAPPVLSSKPLLNPPTIKPSLQPNSQAQESDPSTPRKKTLPNIFSLGNAPPKPNRPPKVNLEMFTGDRRCVKDDPKQKMGGAFSSQPVMPPPAPSLSLRAPLAKAQPELEEEEEEESYDDVGLSGAPPPLPPGGHPSMKPEDEGGEEMYEDIEELRTPKDSKETREQEKKNEKDKKKRLEQERKEQKEREKKEQEVRKRFKIMGPIQVIHTARARKDCKGGKNDLSLKEGQTIEIVRISDNPDGRWLARTYEGSYGYVKTAAVEVEGASQAQTGGNNSEEFPPPLEEDEIYDDLDDGDLNLPPPPILDENNEGLGAASGDEVYDDVDSSAFPPPPPMNSLPQLKPKGKLEEKDPKKQKKFEKEEKDFRKKFKYTGEITVLDQVTVVPVLTSKKWGNKDLPLKPGEIIDVITKPVDNKLIGRNQDGKFGYVSTSNIVEGDIDVYDDIGEGCIYDND